MQPLLLVAHLAYHAQGKQLLHDVSFELYHGQKVMLIGRSGSGKSLLLQALADILPLEHTMSDAIKLENLPIGQIPPQQYRAKVALFHQTPSLIDGTVLDNLALPFTFKHHQQNSFDKNWHLDKLHKLGKSDDFLGQSIEHLSGGERQIVSFLRTLQLNPTIALFDEVTSALDDKTADDLMRLVLEWHDDAKAFIWVTHNPSEQQKLKAKVWSMNEGILVNSHDFD